jgi:hypothetical protein
MKSAQREKVVATLIEPRVELVQRLRHTGSSPRSLAGSRSAQHADPVGLSSSGGRVDGVPDGTRNLLIRASFRASRAALRGAVMEPLRVFAHHSKVMVGYAALEMASERPIEFRRASSTSPSFAPRWCAVASGAWISARRSAPGLASAMRTCANVPVMTGASVSWPPRSSCSTTRRACPAAR